MRRSTLGAVALIFALPGLVLAADWPYWRGPNHDGVSAEMGWRTDWAARPPKVLWTANVGLRHATVVVAAGRVYTYGDDAEDKAHNQIVYCLDAATGKELWKYSMAVVAYSNQHTIFAPTLDGDALYAYSGSGLLACLDAATGRVRWEKDLVKELGAYRSPSYGYRSCPVVMGDLVIVTTRVDAQPAKGNEKVNLAAFHKATGQLAWLSAQATVDMKPGGGSWAQGGPWGSHWGTPVPATVNGKPVLVYHTGYGVAGIDPATGKNRWEYVIPDGELGDEPGVTAISPVVVDNKILFVYMPGHQVKNGKIYCVEVAPDNTTRQLWKSPDINNWKYGNITAYKGLLFGNNEWGRYQWDPLVCLDLATGKKLWEQKAVGGGFTIADGKLIVWDGERIRVAAASPDGYKELAVSPPMPTAKSPGKDDIGSGGQITPILTNGRVYCRNHLGELFCLDIR